MARTRGTMEGGGGSPFCSQPCSRSHFCAAITGFRATHLPNHGQSPIGIRSVVGAGLLFCLILWLTQSRHWAVALHAGWDWSRSYLYGVPDSGRVASEQLFATHPWGMGG
ncbi:MAG: hypothetical protein ABSD75_22170 [Terriglobales bacterium]